MKTNSDITTLHSLIAANGNCVNLGRHIASTYPALHKDILSNTSFLGSDVKFNERVYCVINSITSVVVNEDLTPARFINLFSGYCVKKLPVAKEAAPKKVKAAPKTKIEEFLGRNEYRNKHLYADGLSEGYDYVVCPVSGARLSMIKDNYIIKVLGMKVEDYPANVQRICNKRKENIKSGLAAIDESTGLTRYEVGQVKARQILSTVDETGKTGYDKKGQKTRATHMSNIDSMGRNGYRRQADARVTTVLDNGLTIEQNAHNKQRAVLAAKGITRSVGASLVSKILLRPIIEYLKENNIIYHFDQAEYVITDPDTNKCYFYDLTIPEFNIAIEYQSNAWHANPQWDDARWAAWHPPKGAKKQANEVLQYDYTKAKSLYKHRNIVTYYVWEDSASDDVKGLLCLLKTQNTKS